MLNTKVSEIDHYVGLPDLPPLVVTSLVLELLTIIITIIITSIIIESHTHTQYVLDTIFYSYTR